MLRYFFCLSFVVPLALNLVLSEIKSYISKRRWLRRIFGLCLFLILLGIGVVVYLNQFGLPGFAKRGVQQRLAELGIQLDFDWLRMDFDGTWKARHLTVGQTDSVGELSVSLDDVSIRPYYSSLFSSRPKLKELGIIGLALKGDMEKGGTNLPPFSLAWPDAGIYWNDKEVLSSTNLQGEAFGVEIDVSLNITNTLALKDLSQYFSGRPGKNESSSIVETTTFTAEEVTKKLKPIKNQLAMWLESRDQIDFQEKPVIRFSLRGNAGLSESLSGGFMMEIGETRFQIGGFERFNFDLNLLNKQESKGNEDRLTGKFNLVGLDTKWAKSESLTGRVSSFSLATNMLPHSIEYQIESSGIDSTKMKLATGSIKGSAIQLPSTAGYFKHQLKGLFREFKFAGQERLNSVNWTLQLTNSLANPLPNKALLDLSLDSFTSTNGVFDLVNINANLEHLNSSIYGDENLDYWVKLAPYKIHFNGSAKQINDGKNLGIDDLLLKGQWKFPNLILDQFDANFGEGAMRASAALNVETRLVKATSNIDFDLYETIDLLSPKAQRWIRQFRWDSAPVISSTIQATLPEWTDKNPDWRVQVRPSLLINGKINSGPLSFRGIELDDAQTDIQYANQTWRLPNLVASRPEGKLKFALISQTGSRDFHFDFHSAINPQAIIPALKDEKQKRAFNLFDFEKSPVVEGQVWGRWREPDQTSFQAKIEATNFTFRAQQVDSMAAGMLLTNGMLSATNIVLARPEGVVTLDALGFDVKRKRLFLTNGIGQVDLVAVSKAIGSKTAKALEPYQFLDPAKVKVNGWIQTGPGRNPASLHFKVDGGAFKFNRFNSQDMNGEIFWSGNSITLTNVISEFYGGELSGDLFAKFNNKQSSEIDFNLQAKQMGLTGFMSDILGRDSGLRGELDGVLDIKAISNDWSSWNGDASISLKDGYLWELPLFGIFSPVLDQMAPGLGASKFSKGTGDFKIINSIVKTRNLELKSPLVRLQYKGDVDFEGKIDAGVVAEPLRDAWVIGSVLGPVLNLALSPIERMLKFRVTGTLNKPEMELKHIPKILLVPVQIPLKLFDDIVPDEISNPKSLKNPKQKN